MLSGRFSVLSVVVGSRCCRHDGGLGGIQTPQDGRPREELDRQWPPGESEPTKYWLSTLEADIPLRRLVRLAKIRWRIEHDYRELKTGLGLDHFEGRTWSGRHHHVTLVSVAHAFCTLRRLDPKALAVA